MPAKLNKQKDRDQVYERFLTADASARYLCRQVGAGDLANHLVPIFWDLQAAHESLVAREANRVLIQLVKSIRAKVVSVDQVKELFQLDDVSLGALLKWPDAKPNRDLVGHLSRPRERAKPGGRRKNI